MKPIVLKADTALLRALIENDPELKLQISAAVLKNISDDAVAVQVMERIKASLDEMAKAKDGWIPSQHMANPWRNNAFHKLLQTLVADQIAVATEELIIKSVTPVIGKVFHDMQPEFQKQIDAMIDASLTSEHIRARLDQKIASLG